MRSPTKFFDPLPLGEQESVLSFACWYLHNELMRPFQKNETEKAQWLLSLFNKLATYCQIPTMNFSDVVIMEEIKFSDIPARTSFFNDPMFASWDELDDDCDEIDYEDPMYGDDRGLPGHPNEYGDR